MTFSGREVGGGIHRMQMRQSWRIFNSSLKTIDMWISRHTTHWHTWKGPMRAPNATVTSPADSVAIHCHRWRHRSLDSRRCSSKGTASNPTLRHSNFEILPADSLADARQLVASSRADHTEILTERKRERIRGRGGGKRQEEENVPWRRQRAGPNHQAPH